MFIIVKAVMVLIFFQFTTQIQALNSLNNYGNNAYPGRCVIDLGTSVALLSFGESVKVESLPCTTIYCIGDGWAMLQTCDRVPPPNDCRYGDFKNLDAHFPKCCKRYIRCD